MHAHVWTGGADSWVWAAPMDGSGPGLGLVLTEGGMVNLADEGGSGARIHVRSFHAAPRPVRRSRT